MDGVDHVVVWSVRVVVPHVSCSPIDSKRSATQHNADKVLHGLLCLASLSHADEAVAQRDSCGGPWDLGLEDVSMLAEEFLQLNLRAKAWKISQEQRLVFRGGHVSDRLVCSLVQVMSSSTEGQLVFQVDECNFASQTYRVELSVALFHDISWRPRASRHKHPHRDFYSNWNFRWILILAIYQHNFECWSVIIL